ncbi:GNAT family N-acetyltransferase [Pseudoruegeria sp. HB172150]|uniref:GNAT family N-acetyltransferase n=1 Tax=Pseudoruegeria sp. HB172150 TaxID=2721164 RepID=UPI001555CCA5|nr:GNAT family N-acetyltransferase [Pseudoruegeria sp. HB172150]
MTPAELADLHARSFTMPRPFTAEEFGELLAAPSCFLCTVPGGFALGRAIAGEAELLTLAVDPDCRRQGLGRNLVQLFEAEAVRRAADIAFLEVADTNAAAHALYLAAGYLETGRRPGYYRAPDGTLVDALIMQKALRPL